MQPGLVSQMALLHTTCYGERRIRLGLALTTASEQGGGEVDHAQVGGCVGRDDDTVGGDLAELKGDGDEW